MNESAVAEPDFPITFGSGLRTSPGLLFADGEYLAVWREGRYEVSSRLQGARISREGASLVSFSGPSDVASFALTHGGPGRVLLITEQFRNGANRLIGNFITPTPDLQSIVVSNQTALLSWLARSGRNYRVQFKSNLADTRWLDLPGDVLATQSVATKADPSFNTSEARRFYRILELP